MTQFGDFQGSVTQMLKITLIINGTTVHVITANAPEEIDYTSYGIDHALSIQVLLLLSFE
jgi:glyceraldehyde 3-phosphate dehydrogenase